MGTISRSTKQGGTTSIQDGQLAPAADVETDMAAVFTEINGELDDANVKTAEMPGAKSFRFTEIAAPSNPAANDILLYARDEDGTTRLVVRDSAGTVQPVGLVPRGYLGGLTLSINASDATNDIDIAAGMAESENTRGNLMVLGSTLVKQIDAAWAVGTNQGGMDTGSVANDTWYYVHLIQRSDTGVVDALFSLSATAPSMPTNYDRRRRIGAIKHGTATNTPFDQFGDYFRFRTTQLMFNVTNPGTAAVTRNALTPSSIVVEAEMNFRVLPHSGENSMTYISPLDATDEAPTNGGVPYATMGSESVTTGFMARVRCKTNSSGEYRTRLASSNTNTAFSGAVLGWHDRRGRFS